MNSGPGLESAEEIVSVNREVVEGRAEPLYIYADRRERYLVRARDRILYDRPLEGLPVGAQSGLTCHRPYYASDLFNLRRWGC